MFSIFVGARRVAYDLYKGFFYGYYDGITGLVKEPVRGAEKEVRILFADGNETGLTLI